VFDRRRFLLERHVDVAHAGESRYRLGHTLDAAAAAHPVDGKFLLGRICHRISSLINSAFIPLSGARARAPSAHGGRQRRSSSALPTTDTELAAIAAPAITGDSRPNAASGIPSTLYANARNRFWRILASVARDNKIASTTAFRSLRTTVMSAASIATADPAPIAKLTSAAASAGASLTPSPTMPVARPSALNARTAAALSAGSTPAR